MACTPDPRSGREDPRREEITAPGGAGEQTSPGGVMSRRSLLGTVRPCGGFVVAGAGFEASVQDSDEPVTELAQRCSVAEIACPDLVVVGPRTGRGSQGREGLVIQCVDEPVVVHEPGQHDLLLAAGRG
jgi:hypothetical protein